MTARPYMDHTIPMEPEAAGARSPKRDWLFVNCREGGHKWKSDGGKNCGCEWMGADGPITGSCSIPVYTCEVCGGCDYGDNDDAREVKLDCEEKAELN